jgi:hypothetical protein
MAIACGAKFTKADALYPDLDFVLGDVEGAATLAGSGRRSTTS